MKQSSIAIVLAAILLLSFSSAALAGSQNGRAGAVPAFYDGRLFMINLKDMPPSAEGKLLAHNGSINTIYMATGFTNVIDAIQGDGFNPLWQEMQITFLTISPKQFTSDDQILAAKAAGQISLTPSGLDRCSVLGPGPK